MPRGIPRRFSASTPGRIAAATMKPRKTSERTSFSFHSARAPTTTATPTSVATNAFRAVPAIPGISRLTANGANPVWSSPQERICLEERRHGIVLLRPFVKALALGAFGAGLSWIGGPLTIPRALVLACAAVVAGGGGGGGGAAAPRRPPLQRRSLHEDAPPPQREVAVDRGRKPRHRADARESGRKEDEVWIGEREEPEV